jgi:hypothetical protein
MVDSLPKNPKNATRENAEIEMNVHPITRPSVRLHACGSCSSCMAAKLSPVVAPSRLSAFRAVARTRFSFFTFFFLEDVVPWAHDEQGADGRVQISKMNSISKKHKQQGADTFV